MRANIVEVNGRDIEITRIDNCINGNPRYVVHFLSIADTYIDAINIAKQIGGKNIELNRSVVELFSLLIM